MSFRYQVIVSAYRNSVASGKRSLLAQNGHRRRVGECPLPGEERKSSAASATDAIDPQTTFWGAEQPAVILSLFKPVIAGM